MMVKHSILGQIESEAARMGFFKKRVPPDFKHVQWAIKCSKCSLEFATNSWAPNTSVELMRKNIRARNWDVDIGMRPLCPACAHGHDRGPLAKPNHQSNARWIPPQTAITNALMDAAVERANKERREQAKLDLANAERELAEMKAEKRALCGTMAEAEKAAAGQARAHLAKLERTKRLDEAAQASMAASEALRIARLKEQREREALTIHTPVEKEPDMKPSIAPAPKISHAVFQCLDGVFDIQKRLYKSGYTDQRVARDCGTSEEVVAYLRTETFGQLAEDPRISSVRDDLELLRLESAESFAKLQKTLGEIASRVEQLAHR